MTDTAHPTGAELTAPAPGFAYAMPFGAQVQPDGSVRFRLWAPSVEAVDLVLEPPTGPRHLPMRREKGGWFALTTDQAGAGSAYRFGLPDGRLVPDPASRFQAHDVHGPSTVIDPRAHVWQQPGFPGRPWEETVLYELHIGTFTRAGTYLAAIDKLEHLWSLGITAVQLMPLADFAGGRNWGYDGVLPFAPDASYGTPDELKQLVDAIHTCGMQAFLDVVYNHFGPEGNHLDSYAKPFFDSGHQTPWGAGLDFSARPVRDFFIHNALYWLEEYRFDGLRLDAVHTIRDEGEPDILTELAKAVRDRFGDQHVHLILENDSNQASHLRRRKKDGAPKAFTAQWNDDFHHAAHVLLTGETGGYYRDFADRPVEKLARALAEGFAYQGEESAHRGGARRGEPSADLPPTAFVSYLQTHDQVGNRARGERLCTLAPARALRAMVSLHLLSPQIPMIFMGEEWGARTPFHFFCDFRGDLADGVRQGRLREFADFPQFADPAILAEVPDPNAEASFTASKLDWEALAWEEHEDWLAFYGVLLRLRHTAIIPRLAGTGPKAQTRAWDSGALTAAWELAGGARLSVAANLAEGERTGFTRPDGDLLFETEEGLEDDIDQGRLPGWSAIWFLTGEPARRPR